MWEGDYSFFDYKYNIVGYNGEDYDNFRGAFMVVSLVSIFIILLVLGILLRNKDKRKILGYYLKVLAIVMPILEITKVTWESYYDITTGRGFNWEGLLPIYTCSLFIYCSIIAGFGKGKIKDYCTCWISTIGVVGGMSNVIFIQGLKWYPLLTFGAFYSMAFHYIMVFSGFFIVVMRYKDFTFKDIWNSFIPHLVFSLIVVPIDYIKGWDYMQYYSAGGVPVIEGISSTLASHGLRFLTVFLMLFAYAVLTAAFISIYIGCYKLVDYLKVKFNTKKSITLGEV